MKNNDKIELNGEKLNVKELTFSEVDMVLNSLIDPTIHAIEMVSPEKPVPALAIALSTGVDVDDLNNLTPTAAKQLIEEVEQTNPFLCQAIESMAAIAQEAQKATNLTKSSKPESETLEEQPAS